MSDDDLPKYPLVKALEYIDKHTGSSACPFCQNVSWVAETDADTVWELAQDSPAPTYVMKDPRGFFGPAPSVPALTLTCTKCGFMRSHNLPWIMEKIGKPDESA